MFKSDIKIADDICIMVYNPITGYTKVDVVKVEQPNRKSIEEGLVVYFNKADERQRDTLCYIDLTIPIYHTQEHINSQNRDAERQAKERGYDRLDRYVVREMKLKKIYIDAHGDVQLDFVWLDYVDCWRIYCSQDYKLSYNKERCGYFASCSKPTFYF